MSLAQLKKLQDLSNIFSQGKANLQQVQQLSTLLGQINSYDDENKITENEPANFIAASRVGY
jgi:hypothetical protein